VKQRIVQFDEKINQYVCGNCYHSINDHATGTHRPYWPCEHPNCECQDYGILPPMKEPEKLDFRFLQSDDILEAKIELDGKEVCSYTIMGIENDFYVAGYFNLKNNIFQVGNFPNIYKALDAANEHYNKEYKKWMQ
jgi:hypothetical protein